MLQQPKFIFPAFLLAEEKKHTKAKKHVGQGSLVTMAKPRRKRVQRKKHVARLLLTWQKLIVTRAGSFEEHH
jgi:hypothetical protein